MLIPLKMGPTRRQRTKQVALLLCALLGGRGSVLQVVASLTQFRVSVYIPVELSRCLCDARQVHSDRVVWTTK